MKLRAKILAACAVVALLAPPAHADLIITEIVDGSLPVLGHPRFIELTNTGNETVDLSAYSLGFYNAGQTTLETGISYLLDGSLGPCESYVVAMEVPADPPLYPFVDVYGFEPDLYLEDYYGSIYLDGDDVIALFLGWPAFGDGTNIPMVDVYGVIGVSGNGQQWDYTDSYAVRLGSTASANFDPTDWSFAGAHALADPIVDTELQLMRELTTPGTHECTPTAVGDWTPSRGAVLYPNVPNPFNPRTAIRFTLAESGQVELTIYDVAGRKVRHLVRGYTESGEHEVFWYGRDDRGMTVASGVYVCELKSRGTVGTRRMTLVK